MNIFRFSQWDGSQQIFEPSEEELMGEMADDLMNHGDVMRSLRNLFRQGMQGESGQRMQGLRDMLDRLKARRQEQLERYNLDSVMDDLKLIGVSTDSLHDENAFNIELPAESLIIEVTQHVFRFTASTEGYPLAGEEISDLFGERGLKNLNLSMTKVILDSRKYKVCLRPGRIARVPCAPLDDITIVVLYDNDFRLDSLEAGRIQHQRVRICRGARSGARR